MKVVISVKNPWRSVQFSAQVILNSPSWRIGCGWDSNRNRTALQFRVHPTIPGGMILIHALSQLPIYTPPGRGEIKKFNRAGRSAPTLDKTPSPEVALRMPPPDSKSARVLFQSRERQRNCFELRCGGQDLDNMTAVLRANAIKSASKHSRNGRENAVMKFAFAIASGTQRGIAPSMYQN